MGAPPSGLVSALRNGTVARHIFFRMEHSQGTVLAWDGIGQFELSGEVYHGVGSFAEIDGASNSGDIQNHQVALTLNAVPYDVLRTTDTDIKDQPARLTAVWVTEGGAAVASRIIFAGKGSFLKLKTGAETATLRVFLRGLAVDWARVPRAYYADVDQNRFFPGDSGCGQVSGLENSVIAGWQSTADGGSDPYAYMPSVSNARILRSSDNKVVGHDTWGPFFVRGSGSLVFAADGTTQIVTRTALNDVVHDGSGQPIRANSQLITFDGSDYAVSSLGNRIVSDDNPTSDDYALRLLVSTPGTVTSGWKARSFGSGTSRLVAAGYGAGSGPTTPAYQRVLFDEFDPGEVRFVREAVGSAYGWFLKNLRTGRKYASNGASGKEIQRFYSSASTDPNLDLMYVTGSGNSIETDTHGRLVETGVGALVYQVGLSNTQSRLRIWAQIQTCARLLRKHRALSTRQCTIAWLRLRKLAGRRRMLRTYSACGNQDRRRSNCGTPRACGPSPLHDI